MHARGSGGGVTESRRSETGSTHYCLLPQALAELRDELARGLATHAPFEVLVDRRRRERRRGGDRRRQAGHPPAGLERRLADDIEGRRLRERRAILAPVEVRPPLPPSVRRHADRIRFVRRDERRRLAEDAVRVSALARQWRDRCRQASHEAAANLIRHRSEGRDALAAALGARDAYTRKHSAAVVSLALVCGEEIGLPADAMRELHDIALLHDIGKIAIPDTILRKRAPLSDAEWEIMRQHPVVGARILESLDTLRELAPAVQAEHERWDGRGYPDGLRGDQIPLPSRIVFACDAYHAMVSRRPYRDPLAPEEARGELARNIGTQFSPEAIALLDVLERAARS